MRESTIFSSLSWSHHHVLSLLQGIFIDKYAFYYMSTSASESKFQQNFAGRWLEKESRNRLAVSADEESVKNTVYLQEHPIVQESYPIHPLGHPMLEDHHRPPIQ